MLKLHTIGTIVTFLSPDDPDHSFDKRKNDFIEWDGFIHYCPKSWWLSKERKLQLEIVKGAIEHGIFNAQCGVLRAMYDPVIIEELREWHPHLCDKIEEIEPPMPDIDIPDDVVI